MYPNKLYCANSAGEGFGEGEILGSKTIVGVGESSDGGTETVGVSEGLGVVVSVVVGVGVSDVTLVGVGVLVGVLVGVAVGVGVLVAPTTVAELVTSCSAKTRPCLL